MSEFKRRDFLKTLTAAAAVPMVLRSTGTAAETPTVAAEILPDIPTCESMRSITMTHKFLDLFNPPGLTNQWGCAQAAMDVAAVRSIAFPPFAQGEMNVAPLGSGGELLTAVLYIDEEYYASTKTPIEFVWRPDRVERKSIYKGLELKSTTIMPFETMSVAVKLTVTNMTKARRKTQIKLAINGGATKSVKPWNAAYSPGEYDNERTIDTGRNAILCKSKHTEAFVLQGCSPKPNELLPSWMIYELDLAPRESASIVFVNSLGATAAAAQKDLDAIINNFDAVQQRRPPSGTANSRRRSRGQ